MLTKAVQLGLRGWEVCVEKEKLSTESPLI